MRWPHYIFCSFWKKKRVFKFIYLFLFYLFIFWITSKVGCFQVSCLYVWKEGEKSSWVSSKVFFISSQPCTLSQTIVFLSLFRSTTGLVLVCCAVVSVKASLECEVSIPFLLLLLLPWELINCSTNTMSFDESSTSSCSPFSSSSPSFRFTLF